MNNLQDEPLGALIGMFEKDIEIGCHSLTAEVSRSAAGQEIQRRGTEVVLTLSTYVVVRYAGNKPEESTIRKAFAMLMAHNKENLLAMSNFPPRHSDLDAWYQWLCSVQDRPVTL